MILEEVVEVGSTSEALKLRLAEGERALLARRQTAGRGRLGREWATIEGNLFLSVLLRPGRAVVPGHWSLLAAVALAGVVGPLVPDGAWLALKWPNDLMLARGKLAGILLEAGDDGSPWLVMGFGVNLAGAPSGLGRPTACLADWGLAPAPLGFAVELLAALELWRGRYLEAGFGPVREAWLEWGPRRGMLVAARVGERTMEGSFAGIGEDGALLIDGAAGRVAIAAGEVVSG